MIRVNNEIELDGKFSTLHVGNLYINGKLFVPFEAAQLAYFFTPPLTYPFIELPLNSYLPSLSINTLGGSLVLQAPLKYFVETRVEQVVFENHLGSLTLQWFNGGLPVGGTIEVTGLGESQPTYGFKSSDFFILTPVTTTLSLEVVSASGVVRVEKVAVKVATIAS